MLNFIEHTYALSAPDLTPNEVHEVVAAAVERALAKHLDFERFLPGIDFLSRVVFCAHNDIPLDDYIETLYCCVKHGDFTRSWRQQLRTTATSG